MRMKFGRLIARGEGWRAAVLASPHYAGLKSKAAIVVWCDVCGDWLPRGHRSELCAGCAAERDRVNSLARVHRYRAAKRGSGGSVGVST